MFKKILSICLIGIMLLSLAACGDKEPDVFSAMTMSQKRAFVAKYISDTYSIDVGVTSDVTRLKDSEYSYAVARTADGKQIHCWIKEDKTVVDDKFILDKEKEFVDFCFANEASPGTMVCMLFARAIDSLYPQRARDIRNSYIVNARPMFGSKTHHNCVQTIRFSYPDAHNP